MNGAWVSALGKGSLGGMQLAWFALAVLVLNRRVAGDALPWLSILSFYPLSAFLNFLLRRRIREWKGFLAVNGLAGFAAFAILLGFQGLLGPAPEAGSWPGAAARFFNPYRTEFLILGFSAAAWVLGHRLAALRVSFAALFSEFQFGLVLLFVALFAENLLEMNLPHLIPLVLLFFGFALTGLGATHGRENAGWTSGRFFRAWFVFLLVFVTLILSVGLLITVLASPAFVQFLFSLLYRAGQFLFEILGRVLGFLLSLLPLPGPSLPPQPASAPPAARPEDWSPFFFFISDSTREILRVLWTIMVFSVLLIALWRISSQILDWLRRRMGAVNGDEIEPLPGAFRDDLRVLFLWLLDTLSLKWLVRLLARRKRRRRESDTLRQIYLLLLKWAAGRGCRRRACETPFDYLPRLAAMLPEAQDDFSSLTRHYVHARYAAAPPPAEVLQEVKDRWENIRRLETKGNKTRKKKGDPVHEGNKT